jgi:hypothetical protein
VVKVERVRGICICMYVYVYVCMYVCMYVYSFLLLIFPCQMSKFSVYVEKTLAVLVFEILKLVSCYGNPVYFDSLTVCICLVFLPHTRGFYKAQHTIAPVMISQG